MKAALWIAGVVVACAALFFGTFYRPVFWQPSMKALDRSLAHELGATTFGNDSCRRIDDDVRSCGVFESRDSTDVFYLVRMRGRRCWVAEVSDGSLRGSLPAAAKGCVGLLDRLGLFD